MLFAATICLYTLRDLSVAEQVHPGAELAERRGGVGAGIGRAAASRAAGAAAQGRIARRAALGAAGERLAWFLYI